MGLRLFLVNANTSLNSLQVKDGLVGSIKRDEIKRKSVEKKKEFESKGKEKKRPTLEESWLLQVAVDVSDMSKLPQH